MRAIRRVLLGLTVAVAGVAALLSVPSPARAQGDAVRCESIDGRYNRCPVPWRDARLVRQNSDTRCIRGETWGIDRRGLWVDNGCRGVFAATGYDGYPGGGSSQVTCESIGGRYNRCRVDMGRSGRVRIVRQLSDTRCREGQSWGYDRGGIWVDNGCRARFQVDRGW